MNLLLQVFLCVLDRLVESLNHRKQVSLVTTETLVWADSRLGEDPRRHLLVVVKKTIIVLINLFFNTIQMIIDHNLIQVHRKLRGL